jgi:hypothetical protein
MAAPYATVGIEVPSPSVCVSASPASSAQVVFSGCGFFSRISPAAQQCNSSSRWLFHQISPAAICVSGVDLFAPRSCNISHRIRSPASPEAAALGLPASVVRASPDSRSASPAVVAELQPSHIQNTCSSSLSQLAVFGSSEVPPSEQSVAAEPNEQPPTNSTQAVMQFIGQGLGVATWNCAVLFAHVGRRVVARSHMLLVHCISDSAGIIALQETHGSMADLQQPGCRRCRQHVALQSYSHTPGHKTDDHRPGQMYDYYCVYDVLPDYGYQHPSPADL